MPLITHYVTNAVFRVQRLQVNKSLAFNEAN